MDSLLGEERGEVEGLGGHSPAQWRKIILIPLPNPSSSKLVEPLGFVFLIGGIGEKMAFIRLIIFSSADVPFLFFSPSGFVHVQGGGGGGGMDE